MTDGSRIAADKRIDERLLDVAVPDSAVVEGDDVVDSAGERRARVEAQADEARRDDRSRTSASLRRQGVPTTAGMVLPGAPNSKGASAHTSCSWPSHGAQPRASHLTRDGLHRADAWLSKG